MILNAICCCKISSRFLNRVSDIAAILRLHSSLRKHSALLYILAFPFHYTSAFFSEKNWYFFRSFCNLWYTEKNWFSPNYLSWKEPPCRSPTQIFINISQNTQKMRFFTGIFIFKKKNTRKPSMNIFTAWTRITSVTGGCMSRSFVGNHGFLILVRTICSQISRRISLSGRLTTDPAGMWLFEK